MGEKVDGAKRKGAMRRNGQEVPRGNEGKAGADEAKTRTPKQADDAHVGEAELRRDDGKVDDLGRYEDAPREVSASSAEGP